MNTRLSRNVVLFIAWTFGILVPLYSVSRSLPAGRSAFDWVFQTDASHVLMHTFLYAVLAGLLVPILRVFMLSTGRMIACALATVAVVAVSQEGIQMLCEHIALGSDEIFDFFVDLNAGMLGIMTQIRVSRRRTEQNGSMP